MSTIALPLPSVFATALLLRLVLVLGGLLVLRRRCRRRHRPGRGRRFFRLHHGGRHRIHAPAAEATAAAWAHLSLLRERRRIRLRELHILADVVVARVRAALAVERIDRIWELIAS